MHSRELVKRTGQVGMVARNVCHLHAQLVRHLEALSFLTLSRGGRVEPAVVGVRLCERVGYPEAGGCLEVGLRGCCVWGWLLRRVYEGARTLTAASAAPNPRNGEGRGCCHDTGRIVENGCRLGRG